MRTPHLALLVGWATCHALVAIGCGKDRSATDAVPGAPAGGEAAGEAADPILHAAFHDDADFQDLPLPKEGDWLDRFPEPGQTVAEYRASDPRGRTEARTKFAVQPIGPFTEEGQRVVQDAAEFAEIFLTMPVEVAPGIDLPGPPDRTVAWGDQYRTGRMLDEVIKPRLPANAVGLMGLTMADLYPDDSWNYVFGQATWHQRVGVYSIVRYFPEFWGEPRSEVTDRQALVRTMAVFVHEAGHMLGIRHCIDYRCVMNGCNSLPELDASPLFLCPHDLEKLHGNLGFDVVERYEKLLDFCQTHGLAEDAAWLGRRLATVRGETRAIAD